MFTDLKIINLLKSLFCLHKNKECITNLHGDVVNMVSTKRHIYRSVWRCTRCGKCFYSEHLDPDCVTVNWYMKRKEVDENGNNI